jgi:dihydroxy-acid dehydratase
MPEAGLIPIPRKLARLGVRDMVRISDGRMSGTAAGTIVLHATPEAAVGGALALVQTGDRIRLSVARRSLQLLVDERTLDDRRSRLPPRTAFGQAERGYRGLFLRSVLQADGGCDFDFLRAPHVDRSVP